MRKMVCFASFTLIFITFVTALFADAGIASGQSQVYYRLAVTKSITSKGTGSITSEPTGVDCGKTCSHKFDPGTIVTLTACPDTTTTFIGWSGGCTGNDTTCMVTMDKAKTIRATFTGARTLTTTKVLKKGGGGTVDGSGINCGPTCKASYKLGAQVTLTASPEPNSTFLGWSGAGCMGSGTCTVTMDKAKTIKATFTGATSPAQVTIDWSSYLNWSTGRAWQYKTTEDESAFSEYIADTETKSGCSVTVVGRSKGWSDQLDYWYTGPDGLYYVGFYDGDKTKKDILFSTPCLVFPDTIIPGLQYTQTCVSEENTTVKLAFEFVDDVTTPYGSFDNVLKVTSILGSGSSNSSWYAKGVGQIENS